MENNKNTFCVTWLGGIGLILMLCFFGVNSSMKGTSAVTSCESGWVPVYSGADKEDRCVPESMVFKVIGKDDKEYNVDISEFNDGYYCTYPGAENFDCSTLGVGWESLGIDYGVNKCRSGIMKCISYRYAMMYECGICYDKPNADWITSGDDYTIRSSSTCEKNSEYKIVGWEDSFEDKSFKLGQKIVPEKSLSLECILEKITTSSGSGGSTSDNTSSGSGESSGGSDLPEVEDKIQPIKATFDYNDGSGREKSATCTPTSKYGACEVTFPSVTHRDYEDYGDEYKLLGWSTKSTCSQYTTDKVVALEQDFKYYACWKLLGSESDDSNLDVDNKLDAEGNTTESPQTGEIAIAFVWFAGLLAIGYSIYYIREIKQQ